MLELGVAAVGPAFRPAMPAERGGGRAVIDTGSREALLGGGLGIKEGVRKGAWQFPLGDLTDDEVDQLYALQLDAGLTRTILAIDGEPGKPAVNERLHWSVFDKLEFYERVISGKHRWSLKIEGWA